MLSGYNSYTTILLANGDAINASATKTYYIVLWISETGSSQSDIGDFTGVVTFSTEKIDYAKQTLVKLGLTANSGTPNFDSIATTNEGIYAAEDDLGTSYYFRGAVDNNWVYFAGIYWRIIRINGDGSIRMIYSGTTAPTSSQAVVMTGNETQVGTSKFNDIYNDNKYLGYIYNNNILMKNTNDSNNIKLMDLKFLASAPLVDVDSTIKDFLDWWYANTLLNTLYEQYLVDAIYCNDREVSTNANLYTAWNTALGGTILDVTSTTLGQGTTPTLYKSDERLGYYGGSVSPTLKCNQASDRYTVSTSLGNGKLNYKVGLITADELVMAGAKDGLGDAINQTENTLNTSYYLYNGVDYWTLTPRVFNGDRAYVWDVDGSNLYSGSPDYSLGARPVVSLSSNVTISGNGTYSSPFKIRIPK